MTEAPRLLVTGAGGFAGGWTALAAAASGWEVHALSGKPAPAGLPPGIRWRRLDILDPAALAAAFAEISPRAAVHSAALADVDGCERDPAAARDVNIGLTRSIAGLAARAGVRLVHLSTDTVFDGEKGNYKESDRANPINVYGRTKVESEIAVILERGDFVIARTALVMGFPPPGWEGGNSFMARWLRTLREGGEIAIPPGEIRTPTSIFSLARALTELAGHSIQGAIHLAGTEAVDRLELARMTAKHWGFDPARCVARDPSGIPNRAARPRDVSLDVSLARSVLATPMTGLEEALASTPVPEAV